MTKPKITSRIKTYIANIPNRLLEKQEHKKIVRIYTYIIMTGISFVMTVLNIFSDVGFLTWATLAMCVLSALNIVLAIYVKNGVNVSSIFFAVEVVFLFTVFIITGNPKGFSILWIALLPPISMLFYGRKYGSLLSIIMLVILIFFLRTNLGISLLFSEAKAGYTETFRIRFPFLYVACFVLAYVLEVVQSVAYAKVEEKKDELNYFSKHDFLTGLYNRSGALEQIDLLLKESKAKYIYIGIFDVDHFKQMNDKYGHLKGDKILQAFGNFLKTQEKLIPCRWGGDEFAFALASDTPQDDYILRLSKDAEKIPLSEITEDDAVLKVSAGVYEAKLFETKSLNDVDKYLKIADNLLYQVKKGGISLVKIER